MLLALAGNPVARLLVEAGADGGPGAFGVASATPLALCLFYGQVECGRVLLGAVRGRTPRRPAHRRRAR